MDIPLIIQCQSFQIWYSMGVQTSPITIPSQNCLESTDLGKQVCEHRELFPISLAYQIYYWLFWMMEIFQDLGPERIFPLHTGWDLFKGICCQILNFETFSDKESVHLLNKFPFLFDNTIGIWEQGFPVEDTAVNESRPTDIHPILLVRMCW